MAFYNLQAKKLLPKNLTGFTLIEMLVVIVIISILISIAIPRMEGFRSEANIVKARVETRALMAAIESYYLNRTPLAYPSSTTTICSSVLNQLKPLIISDVLYDPFQQPQTEYNYIRSDNGKYYVLFSVGMNGSADITGINNAGVLTGSQGDDIYATNGIGF